MNMPKPLFLWSQLSMFTRYLRRTYSSRNLLNGSFAGTWSGAFKAGSQIYRENGIFGLFQGHSATLLRIYPYAAIKFMAYDQIEHVCHTLYHPPELSLTQL